VKKLIATATLVVAALALTSCAPQGGTAANEGSDKTLTVWYMQDSFTNDSIAALNKEFTKKTGAKVKVEIQQWDGITTKLITALSSANGPDVFEMGNTQVPLYAEGGALYDLTSHRSDFENSDSWLDGLKGPATVNGKLFALPLYSGARAIVYNKKIWAAAGITTEPTTWSELIADLDAVKATTTSPEFSAFYLAGSNWFGGLPFLYDAGGAIAKKTNGSWEGQLSTPESLKGLRQFKDFQNTYSTVASRSAAMATPDPNVVFESGLAATMIGDGNTVKTVQAAKPELVGQVGSFAWPSQNKSSGIKPSFLGGSTMGIGAKSKNQELGVKYLKLLASTDVQLGFVHEKNGHAPNSSVLVTQVAKSLPPEMQAFYKASQVTVSTPPTAGWVTIEADASLTDFFTQVATGGKSVDQAASDFDSHLKTALNAKK
jgi:N,N'-diacetylchitobiose transport system substrate-binding protein